MEGILHSYCVVGTPCVLSSGPLGMGQGMAVQVGGTRLCWWHSHPYHCRHWGFGSCTLHWKKKGLRQVCTLKSENYQER